MPGGVYEDNLEKGLSPFRNIGAFLKTADLAVANLEGPLSSRGTRLQGKKFTFRVPPSRVSLFKEAGIGVLALANNHILDFGPTALADTLYALDSGGLLHCGAGLDLAAARRPAVAEVKGVRIAFLAYSRTFPSKFWAGKRRPGTAFADTAWVRADVLEAKQSADAVVVLFHWGQEKSHELRDYQRVLAKIAAEAGAVLVVGSHPHIPQGVEKIGGCVVAYSIGDGVFGGAPKRSEGSLVLRASFGREGLREAEFFPLETSNVATDFAPRLQMGAAARKTLDLVKALSADLRTTLAPVVSPEGYPCLRLDMTVSSTPAR